MKKKSILNRIIVVSILFIIIVATVAYNLLIPSIRSNVIKTTGELRLTEAKLVAKNIENFIIRSQRILADVAIHVENIDPNPTKLQEVLDRYKTLLNVFDNGLFVFDASGKLLAETPFIRNERIGLDFSFREYYRKTLQTKKPYVSEPYVSTKSGKYAIMITVPVIVKDEIKYIVAGGINIQSPSNPIGALQNHKIGYNGYYFIYNKNRFFIFHPDNERIAKNDVPVGVNRLFDAAIEGFEGVGETVNSRGLHFLSTFVHIKEFGWILGGNYPIEEALVPYYKTKNEILALTIIITVVVMICSIIIIKYLNNPLLSIASSISMIDVGLGKIKRFEIDEKYDYKEFSLIKDKLNELIDNIKSSQQRLLDMAKNEAIKIIAGGIFHDIGNSIFSANARVYILKKRFADNFEVSKLIDEIATSLNKSADIAKKMLELTSSKVAEKKLVDLKEIVESTSKVCKIDGTFISFDIDCDDNLWLIYGDEISLSQSIQNLLINALQAQYGISNNPIKITIRNIDNTNGGYSNLPKKRYVEITVKDYGHGIAEEDKERIFDLYYSTKPEGTGIGLALVKKVVLEHDGYIFVESEKGVGTTFYIYLPYYAEKTLEQIKTDLRI
ncbi:MAG: ATP-binding protein [Calditerrivibrio sp.]|nr:ATP-binding protein [Calditerrivibrio sp.]